MGIANDAHFHLGVAALPGYRLYGGVIFGDRTAHTR
jgi:hypothetical protein